MRRELGLALVASLLAQPALSACRQALVLGLDVSGSVDATEYRLQTDGLARALGAPEVRAALLNGGGAPVRLAIFEWSGLGDQTLILPWTEITDDVVLAQVQATLFATQRRQAEASTGLGRAMIYGYNLLRQQGECWKRTMDISGDGKSNNGLRPENLPADRVLPDVTVNGLVIGADDAATGDARLLQVGELVTYYERTVIRGPGAFVEVALGFEDFESAMTRKLVRELQSLAIGALQDPSRSTAGP